ncbi:MAG: PEP-CTERM sorting domain-containing protein [Pontiellaceae bacterium]|nr:PEP-CTERM sorting domain-containing protein [Pontiellaceae bacterium]
MRKSKVFLFAILTATAGLGAIVNQYGGSYANWATEWTVLNGLNDADNGASEELDFVGNDLNPCAYWAANDDYVFFRFRLDVGTADTSTFRDSHLLLIDINGNLNPDYGFAWDSKSNDPDAHGLEMLVPDTIGTYWSGTKMDDIDGDSGKKMANDINGGGRTTDGYVRTDDGQSTTTFGTTTFMDFAVSWNYLETYTGLARGQTWNIALGSIANATDHNFITADVAGGANPGSPVTSGWSNPIAVPEPTVIALISAAGFMTLLTRRLFFPR